MEAPICSQVVSPEGLGTLVLAFAIQRLEQIRREGCEQQSRWDGAQNVDPLLNEFCCACCFGVSLHGCKDADPPCSLLCRNGTVGAEWTLLLWSQSSSSKMFPVSTANGIRELFAAGCLFTDVPIAMVLSHAL